MGGKSPDNEKSNELLSRIIQAMKLKKDEFALCQNPRDVFLNMEDYLPLVIVSFGAIATNALLESKERLSKPMEIHQKGISLRNKDMDLSHRFPSFTPIFSPSIPP